MVSMAALPATRANPAETTELSEKYETPMGLAHGTMQALKDRIKLHYDLASDYYLNLWGQHIHHGYWPTPESKSTETKEQAQANLIRLLLSISSVAEASKVLDVGCGIGGTSRFLASTLGCTVTGITISSKQVEIATRLTKAEAEKSSGSSSEPDEHGFFKLGNGKVKFVEMDAETMGERFKEQKEEFDVVWICEALSHIPGKGRFFKNAEMVLGKGGKLIVADWFKSDTVEDGNADIKAIEDGMLLPPLHTHQGYVNLAKDAGLSGFAEPKDISQDVAKTWDISWSLVQNPSLWAFAVSQGRDGIAFLQAFRAMRRGYSNGSFRYAVMAFNKE